MKKILFTLLVLSLVVCTMAFAASAVIEGDMTVLNVIWSDSLTITEAGQTVTYEVSEETYVMSLSVSKKLDGEKLYISAQDGVEVMVNSVTQQPVDGWYVLDVATLPSHQLAIVNWNKAVVELTVKVPAAQPALFDIDVARMILGNSLEFQFGVAKTKIADKTGYYAVIEKTWADGTTTEKIIPATEWDTAGAYWAIVYDGLAAKEMGDTFYVTIYNADGEAISNAKQDAVRDYVERAFAGQTAKGKTMMVDMLNYGAAAQVNFNYGTSDLANSKLTAEQLATGTATAPNMENKQVKGTNYTGSRFILSSAIQVQIGFKGLKDGMYAIYTYTDNNNKVKEVRVESSEFVTSGSSKIGVELGALVYADARALVNVTIYNADGSVHGSATDSIESCCVRSNGDLYVALMKFADSARIFLYNK